MPKVPGHPSPGLHSVRVEGRDRPRQHTHEQVYVIEKGVASKVSSMSNDFAYSNAAYVGSVNSVRDARTPVVLQQPTSVVREQYWACSKWPYAQRILVLAVGVLFGAVLGLALTMALRTNDKDGGFPNVFATHVAAAPD